MTRYRLFKSWKLAINGTTLNKSDGNHQKDHSDIPARAFSRNKEVAFRSEMALLAIAEHVGLADNFHGIDFFPFLWVGRFTKPSVSLYFKKRSRRTYSCSTFSLTRRTTPKLPLPRTLTTSYLDVVISFPFKVLDLWPFMTRVSRRCSLSFLVRSLRFSSFSVSVELVSSYKVFSSCRWRNDRGVNAIEVRSL
jgi:hypothetical protein